MSLSRDHCNAEELAAHAVLDAVRAGIDVPSATIMRALWTTGDAVGLDTRIESTTNMKPLHINEPRCAGRDNKDITRICSRRELCHRHKQLDVDRDMGLTGNKQIKVLNLPYVPGQDCHYFKAIAA